MGGAERLEERDQNGGPVAADVRETEGESEREEFHFVHFFADHFPRSLQTERE